MSTLRVHGLTLGYDRFGDARDEAILLISGLGVQRLRWADGLCERLEAKRQAKIQRRCPNRRESFRQLVARRINWVFNSIAVAVVF